MIGIGIGVTFPLSGDTGPPPTPNLLLTEDSDVLATESGDQIELN